MKVMVVGATGFIGSVVAERLTDAGHQVVALVQAGVTTQGLPAGTEVRLGDLTAPATLTAAMSDDVEGVVHLATPTGEVSVDVAATDALLAPLRGTGRPFVYTSGLWVLGPTGPAPADEDSAINPLPIVGYRPTIESQVLTSAQHGVRATVIRPAIAHGRGGGIPAMLVGQARACGGGRYVGSADVTWPMVHVDDLADLFVAALERADPGTLLHAVAEEAVAVTALADAAGRAAGVTGTVQAWPLTEPRRARGSVRRRSRCQSGRLRGPGPPVPEVAAAARRRCHRLD